MKSLYAVGLWTVIGAIVSSAGTAALAEEEQPAPAAAQESAYAPSFCHCDGDASANAKKIRQVLAQPLKSAGLDFSEEPLENIVNFMQEEYEIQTHLDDHALNDLGLTRDEPVTVKLQNISLKSALRLLLSQLGLTYCLRHESLFVTSPNRAEEELETCVYDVRDLAEVYPPSPHRRGAANANFDPLIDAITSCVDRETWAENGGGEAEIRILRPGLLIVSQTDTVHDDIASFLEAIRVTLKQPVSTTPIQSPAMRGGRSSRGRGMEGGFGGKLGGGIAGRGAGMAGEMGPEPTPAEEVPPK